MRGISGNVGKDVPIYPIGSMEKITGLTARQIRYYETKGLLDPVRTEGNQRLYTQSQVDRLVTIKKLMDDGYSLKSIREVLEEAARDRAGLPEDPERYAVQEEMVRQGLRSLYPISDYARLMRLLEQRDSPPDRPGRRG